MVFRAMVSPPFITGAAQIAAIRSSSGAAAEKALAIAETVIATHEAAHAAMKHANNMFIGIDMASGPDRTARMNVRGRGDQISTA